MSDIQFHAVESKRGRTIVGRLTPGADLIGGLEKVCDAHSIKFAAIVFAYGSLANAHFKILQKQPRQERATLTDVTIDSRVEFLGGQGLVCRNEENERETHLHGSVADASGVVKGGHFVKGRNPIYNNLDFTLVELSAVDLVRRWDEETQTVEMEVFSADEA